MSSVLDFIDELKKNTEALLNIIPRLQAVEDGIAKSPQLTSKMAGSEDKVKNLGDKQEKIL